MSYRLMGLDQEFRLCYGTRIVGGKGLVLGAWQSERIFLSKMTMRMKMVEGVKLWSQSSHSQPLKHLFHSNFNFNSNSLMLNTVPFLLRQKHRRFVTKSSKSSTTATNQNRRSQSSSSSSTSDREAIRSIRLNKVRLG